MSAPSPDRAATRPLPVPCRPRLRLSDIHAISQTDLPAFYTSLHAHLTTLPHSIVLSLTPLSSLHARLSSLRATDPTRSLPLHGQPYFAKDNIDAPPHPTTNGCPAASHLPLTSATVIARLTAAGAVLLGKTAMDQFATGLVGTRSPYGIVPNAADSRFISGGSSSGSATALAAGCATFTLATDTAGSGRVPAAMQRLVGFKPTRGIISCHGVAPACRSLDCIAVFANNVSDATIITAILTDLDIRDPFSRIVPNDKILNQHDITTGDMNTWMKKQFSFGVPIGERWPDFDGDDMAKTAFQTAVSDLEKIGGQKVNVSYEPFERAARLLYEGPFVAERFLATGALIRERSNEAEWKDAFDPTVCKIILGGEKKSATEVFQAMASLGEIRQIVDRQVWPKVDVLIVPSVPRAVTHAEVAADPIGCNSMLGWYTNFVNLLDYCAVAVPTRDAIAHDGQGDGVPRGVTVIGRAFDDRRVAAVAHRLEQITLSGGA